MVLILHYVSYKCLDHIFFQIGTSKLTKEAVDKHDSKTFKKNGTSIADDLESFGGKTFKTFDTFASDWSACSNQSFNK